MPRYSDESDTDFRPSRARSHTPGPRRRDRDRDLSPPYPPSSAAENFGPYASGALGTPEKNARFSDAPPAPIYDSHTPFYPPDEAPRPRDSQTNHNTSIQPRSSRPRSSRFDSEDSLTTTNTPSTVSSYRTKRSSRSRDRNHTALARRRNRSSSTTTSSSSGDSDRDEHIHPRGPIHKTKKALENTFTPSTSGLGVGVLGAIVGGLAASEIEHRAHKKHGHKGEGGHRHGDDKGVRLLSTIVGAAVGGLGANALEKKLERKRETGEREGKAGKEVRDLERRVWEEEKGMERDRERERYHRR
ncbi:hypothetical protein QBC35DRAFT_464979 [Podospora australis]|uniref:Uncharacterized protein n=1 Tax=Podospora australis TaxID=1536484 RepID=A0AAN6WQ67_9PEZI|nr:hypothetical protein QBC35DRAFT_464979 [Podospora australis]